MKVNEILALINAGYTKEEISAMENPKPADPKPADPKPDPLKDLTTVVTELAAQVKAMQADNIAAARQKETEKETSDSVIKSFFDKI